MSSRGGVRSLARAVGEGALSAAEVAREVSEAIAAGDAGENGVNAFLSHDANLLSARAAALDEALEAARREGRSGGRLAGVAVALKDNLCTTDHPTTCGSRILEGYRSPYEATVVRRLRSAGALIAGKTNMDEFAMGSSTENSAFGPTRNPHDRARVPGGSSGGSAAAVAAGMVPAALGSDTAGSVRQPASFCGVVGLKPTYGAVSRYGLVAFASSLDQVGTLGRTVEDAALLLEVIAGRDTLDSTCADRPAPTLLPELDRGVDGLVVGVPEEYFPGGLDPGVRRLALEALEALESAGARVRPVSLPTTPLAIPTYYVIGPAEASSNLARFDGARFGLRVDAETTEAMSRATRSRGFGDEVKRRVLLGTHVLSAGQRDRFYARAGQVRARLAAEFAAVFDSGVDVLFTPTTPAPAFPMGDRTGDPYRMYLADVFTVPVNFAGIPAVTVPIGTVAGLPVGGQIIAPAWGEPVMVRAAAALERVVGGAR
ncbi:MAG: Asp-tRNA(Asn)/Glu-tRNA(Gln) amidotransferase subunit GatA [Gemmatimonadetes bacterium]|nr:Asp-tRNA(Asn)/Glu-tRNA(Gln) amidotransferase subunit GatA [Gemmatimonadota bacterium]